MPIAFKCPTCGATGKAGDKYAGREVACPKCRGPIRFAVAATPPPPPLPPLHQVPPPRVIAPEPDEFDPLSMFDPKAKRSTYQPNTTCRFCGGEVPISAVKCRHCGEIIDAEFKRQRDREAASAAPLAPAWSRGVAAVLSFFWPGLWQINKGQILNGFAWMFFTFLGYLAMILPGLVLHVLCIAGAASGDPYAAARRERDGR